MALHRQKHVFPVMLTVTKTTQGDMQGFLGLFQPLEENDDAFVWLTTAGLILSINKPLTNVLGHTTADICGKNLRCIAADQEDMEHHVRVCACICVPPQLVCI